MRRVLPLSLMLGLACGGPSGGNDGGGGGDAPAAAAHATLAWRVRCDEMPGCTAPPAHTIDADDGAGGHVVSCDATSFDGLERFLELDAELTGSYGVHVSGATFPLAGGRIGGDACTVSVVEGTDALEGACSANLPSADAPCQIQRLTIDAGVLSFQMRCDGIEIAGAPGLVREVGPATTTTGYFDVTVTGCHGL